MIFWESCPFKQMRRRAIYSILLGNSQHKHKESIWRAGLICYSPHNDSSDAISMWIHRWPQLLLVHTHTQRQVNTPGTGKPVDSQLERDIRELFCLIAPAFFSSRLWVTAGREPASSGRGKLDNYSHGCKYKLPRMTPGEAEHKRLHLS